MGEVDSSDWVYTRYGNPDLGPLRVGPRRARGRGGRPVRVRDGRGHRAAADDLPPGDAIAMDQRLLPRRAPSSRRPTSSRAGVELRLAPPAELEGAAGRRDALAGVALEPEARGLRRGRAVRGGPRGGAVCVVDNTTAGPLYQRARARRRLRADERDQAPVGPRRPDARLRVHARPERAQALRHWRTEAGSVAGPFEVWLAHRSLATYALRLERGSANALALAELLAGRDDVSGVRYPEPGDPGHEVAGRQMRGFGTVLGLRPGQPRARRALLDGPRAGHRGDQLRRRADDRRAARALVRRRRDRGLHPAVGRLRGHGRPGGGRGTRARGGVTLLVTGATGYLGPRAVAPRRTRSASRPPMWTSAIRTPSEALFARLRPRAVIHTAYRQDDRPRRSTARSTSRGRRRRTARARLHRRRLRRREGRAVCRGGRARRR